MIAEGVGCWFMQTQMQIPNDRIDAAYWVLHCSLITFSINLISIPYNACIIAHEHMKAFAYVNLIETLLKLLICYLLFISPIDKLISYVILLVLVAILIRLIYGYYCYKHFEESRVKLMFDRLIFKEMFGFAGWNFFSHSGHYFNTQGVNILMNIYFGLTVNAARGIATQVELAVKQFVQNFTISISPQITKSYANKEIDRMHLLVCRGAKFSFFIIMIMVLPICCEIEYILNIWLVEVPKYTVEFIRLSLIMAIIDCVGISGYTACMATGKLKKYSLVITTIEILEFPLVWICFKLDSSVLVAYYLYIFIKLVVLIARMFFLESMVSLKVNMYIRNVFIPILLTTIVAIIPSISIILLIESSFLRLLISTIVAIVVVSISALYLGMTNVERNFIIQKIKEIRCRILK